MKFWAKPDQILLSEITNDSAPQDYFKAYREIRLKSKDLKQSCDKVNAKPDTDIDTKAP